MPDALPAATLPIYPGLGPASRDTKSASDGWCKTNFKGFWEKEVWPPSSPDLNPMDFGIWSILEQKACSTSHPNIETLKQKLKASWEEIDPEVVHATCTQGIIKQYSTFIGSVDLLDAYLAH